MSLPVLFGRGSCESGLKTRLKIEQRARMLSRNVNMTAVVWPKGKRVDEGLHSMSAMHIVLRCVEPDFEFVC